MKNTRTRRNSQHVAEVLKLQQSAEDIPKHPGCSKQPGCCVMAQNSSTRLGATLVEVLVSLLITAIGIMGVASVFPVAVLRAVQATRLNKSVLLRLNAEELIDIDLRVVHDPNGDGDFLEHQIDEDLNGNGVLDPGEDTNGNGVLDQRNFIVDPLGHMMMEDGINTDKFGLLGGLKRWGLGKILDPILSKNPPPSFPAPVNPDADLDRLKYKAAQLVTLPDTWLPQAEDSFSFDGTAGKGNVGDTQLKINKTDHPELFELMEQLIASGSAPRISNPPSRIVFHSANGLESIDIVIDITNSSKDTTVTPETITIAWFDPLTEDIDGLLKVRIESKEFRFSWLLTVRKSAGDALAPALNMTTIPQFGGLITDPVYSNNGSFQKTNKIGPASVDVVVFLNRRFSTADETVYTVTSVSGGNNDEQGRWYKVGFAGLPRPAMKRGGFMLDPVNARWYRIQKIEDETDSEALILLDRGQPPGDKVLAKGIFMKGVIEVFPIGTK